MLENTKQSEHINIGLESDTNGASTSKTKQVRFDELISSVEIEDDTSKGTDRTTKISGTVVPSSGIDRTESSLKNNLLSKPSHTVVNKLKTSSSNRKEVKSIYKPLSTPGLGFVKPNTRSKTPPPRKTNAPELRPRTPQPRSNFGRQGYPNNYPIAWNNSQQRSYLRWEICSPFNILTKCN